MRIAAAEPGMEMTHENVIVVDENDVELGLCEKIQAHKEGILHRAFSVFILRKQHDVVEMLLQKRA